MGQNISLMHYEITRWFSFYFPIFQIHVVLYIQTLTKLNIGENRIGDVGAKHLANALRDNKVILILFSSLSYSCCSLHIDTHHTRPSWQLYWRCWSTMSRRCLKKQQSDSHPIFISLIFIFSTHRHSRICTSSVGLITIFLQLLNRNWNDSAKEWNNSLFDYTFFDW